MIVAAVEPSEVLPGAGAFIVMGLGAFLLPLVARRIRVQAAVLEIVFGLAIGPAALGVIGENSVEEGFLFILAELGLLLLLFLAGFEIDFRRLEREGPGPLLWGLGFYGASLVVLWFGLGFLPLAGTDQRTFLTLLLSAASVGIIVPALRATNRVATRQGQLVIVVGVLAEFLATLGVVGFGVVVQSGLGPRLLAIPGFAVVAGVVLVVMRRLAWWYPEKAGRLFAAHDPDELGIRASLALLFTFVGIALALGIEPILGAFLAGALFGYVFRDTGELETRLTGFAYGFFIPLFFISVGVRFPLDAFTDPQVVAVAVAVAGIAIAAKILPSPVLVWRRLPLRDALGTGVLLAGQLSVIIALAEFGVQLGVIDDGMAAGTILLVGVTAIGSPLLFRLLSPPLTEERTQVPQGWER